MTFAPPSLDLPPEAELDAETIRHCRRVLLSVVDMAHAVAQDMHRRVTAPQEVSAGDPSLAAAAAFDRACRNIRQTVMLMEDFGKGKASTARRGPHRIAARKRIIREVEDVIQRSASGPRAERLYRELRERLELPDLEEELEHRQVGEIVTDLCRDLGVAHAEGTHPWKRRTPADIAALCARAARPAGRPAGGASDTVPIRPTGGQAGGDAAGGAPGGRPPDGPGGVGAGELDDAHLAAPELDGRELHGPALDGPDLEASDQRAPGLEDPELEAPESGGPELRGSELRGSELRGREFGERELGDPDLAAPDRDPPDWDAPDWEVPDPDAPDPRAAGFCDYQPGARVWGSPVRVSPLPAAPDTARLNGTASFRGG